MRKINFTAFDVETANRNRNSICSIGIVKVVDGIIEFSTNYFVKPPDNHYEYWNIKVHGLSLDLTENSPTFPEIWDHIRMYFENQLVVAHNISFDHSALMQTLEFYSLDTPAFSCDCTYKLTKLKLNLACECYGIQLNHHDSLSDALACANLYMKVLNGEKPIISETNIQKSKRNSFFLFNEKISKIYCFPKLDEVKIITPFYGKSAVISGIFNGYSRNEIANLLYSAGCAIKSCLTSKTSFLIIGENYGPAKYEKAKKLKIEIIHESDLKKLLSSFNSDVEKMPEVKKVKINSNAQKIAGKTFVVSGVFTNFSRDEIKSAIEQHGGNVTGSVSGNTDYLVAGENMGPAKRSKAEKLGVKIISEQAFMEMIG